MHLSIFSIPWIITQLIFAATALGGATKISITCFFKNLNLV